jgi:TonB family protein
MRIPWTVPVWIVLLCCSCERASTPDGKADTSAQTKAKPCDITRYQAVWESHFARQNVVRRVTPEYPREAVEERATGQVQVTIVVDRSGRVVEACATSGPESLRAAAEDAARQWTFRPDFGHEPGGEREYTFDGIVFNFTLPPDRDPGIPSGSENEPESPPL